MFDFMNFIPLAFSDAFQNAAQWILKQASWVILAALVILGLKAWMDGRLMSLFGGIVVAGILLLFANNGGDLTLLKSLSEAIKGIFETGS
jgi:hypothetical protein